MLKLPGEYRMTIGTVNIYLVGASIGNAWNLPQFSKRMQIQDISVHYFHGGSNFDKSDKIFEILDNDRNMDYLIIKECAAYFPVEPEYYKRSIEEWISRIREAGVIPILATTVPVTKTHQIKINLYNFIRRRSNDLFRTNSFSATKNISIMGYNRWIRNFSKNNDIPLLDLASVLTKKGSDFLDPSFARIDGLHLNKKGYVQLDNLLKEFLENSLNGKGL